MAALETNNSIPLKLIVSIRGVFQIAEYEFKLKFLKFKIPNPIWIPLNQSSSQ